MKHTFKRYIIVFMSLLLMFSVPTVSEAAKASFAKKTYTVKVKKTVKLKAKHLAKGEKIVKWKVSNPKVAKISKSGKLKALKVGKVKVTATTNKGRKFSCKVKAIKTTQSAVTPPVVTPEPVAPVIVDDTSDDVPDYSGHDIFS